MDNDNAKGTAALGSTFATSRRHYRRYFAQVQHVSRPEVHVFRPCATFVTQ